MAFHADRRGGAFDGHYAVFVISAVYERQSVRNSGRHKRWAFDSYRECQNASSVDGASDIAGSGPGVSATLFVSSRVDPGMAGRLVSWEGAHHTSPDERGTGNAREPWRRSLRWSPTCGSVTSGFVEMCRQRINLSWGWSKHNWSRSVFGLKRGDGLASIARQQRRSEAGLIRGERRMERDPIGFDIVE